MLRKVRRDVTAWLPYIHRHGAWHAVHCLTKGTMSLLKPLNLTRLPQPAQMSFLGVGAPEAILVGVVALVVFGPKGLAEVRRQGKGSWVGPT